MSELSKALGNACPKHQIECNGKTYQVGQITQAVKVGYEKTLYRHCKDAITALRPDLSSDEYMTMLGQLTQAYEDGEFAMEGPRGTRSLKTSKGAIILLSLLLGVDEMETLNLVSQKKDEFALALQMVVEESFPGSRVQESPKE